MFQKNLRGDWHPVKGVGGVVSNYIFIYCIYNIPETNKNGWLEDNKKCPFWGVNDLFSRGKLLVLGRVSPSDIKHGWHQSMIVNGLMVSRFVLFLYLFIFLIPRLLYQGNW